MKVWITKYALTDGIEEIDSANVAIMEVEGTGYLTICRNAGNLPEAYNKKYYSLDKESAIHKAEEMRQKKITSLKKQIEKLERMRFE